MQCSICNKAVESGRYYHDPFGNYAHADHEIESCPVCTRIIGKSSSRGKVEYSDGRFICGLCYGFEKPVKEEKTLTRAFLHAKTLLREKGFDFPQNIEVSLVSGAVFNEAGYSPSMMGLNTSQIGLFESRHDIKVLWGLPFLHTSGILAHEMLHVWQNCKGITPDEYISEGLCELGAGLIYKRSGTALGQILFNNLETNMIAVYSTGFKTMKKLLETRGWQAVREYVINSNSSTNC
ncbi:MAG: protein DA1 [Bacteroidota bacterium]